MKRILDKQKTKKIRIQQNSENFLEESEEIGSQMIKSVNNHPFFSDNLNNFNNDFGIQTIEYSKFHWFGNPMISLSETQQNFTSTRRCIYENSNVHFQGPKSLPFFQTNKNSSTFDNLSSRFKSSQKEIENCRQIIKKVLPVCPGDFCGRRLQNDASDPTIKWIDNSLPCEVCFFHKFLVFFLSIFEFNLKIIAVLSQRNCF